MNEVQQQLADQSAINLAAEAKAVSAGTADALDAYTAYAEATGGKTWDGRDMPAWDQLGERIQGAWRAAAAAVAARYGVRTVTVRVTDDTRPFTTTEPVDGEHFVAECLIESEHTVMSAVRGLSDGRIGVLRVPPFTARLGETVEGTLFTS